MKTVDAARACRAVRARGLAVLTFVGYSGTGYQDPGAMLAAAEGELVACDPRATLVLIGATPHGIGAVYPLAKRLGFATAGIVSSQALVGGSTFSPDVDEVHVVEDTQWGGLLADGFTLSPTSRAMVDASDRLVAIGGNAVAADELAAARAAGKPVRFIPADVHHAGALAYAARRGEPPPTDFRGVAGQREATMRR